MSAYACGAGVFFFRCGSSVRRIRAAFRAGVVPFASLSFRCVDDGADRDERGLSQEHCSDLPRATTDATTEGVRCDQLEDALRLWVLVDGHGVYDDVRCGPAPVVMGHIAVSILDIDVGGGMLYFVPTFPIVVFLALMFLRRLCLWQMFVS